MRIGCVYWKTSSVGGIATHLNSLRTAAIRAGDTFDILHSQNWKNKKPCLFKERQWVRGGDTRIWVDGEVPQNEEGRKWLQANYDGIVYGFICPHETKAYPTPDFLPLYDITLPKLAWVMDGYWDDYCHWAIPLLPKLKGVLCPLESYASPLRKLGVKNLTISAFPFQPSFGFQEPKTKHPSLMWPCQWKNIKGITQFLNIIPSLPSSVSVDLYSNGIRYYQLRTEETWKNAISKDLFQEYNGKGRGIFHGNLDMPEVVKAYQRSWFTVNLQGMTTKKDTYRRGSYNNTEVEALWYGCLPILHESTTGTDLPKDCYLIVRNAEEIPGAVREAIENGYALDPERRSKAREYVRQKHLASNRYQDLRKLFQ